MHHIFHSTNGTHCLKEMFFKSKHLSRSYGTLSMSFFRCVSLAMARNCPKENRDHFSFFLMFPSTRIFFCFYQTVFELYRFVFAQSSNPQEPTEKRPGSIASRQSSVGLLLAVLAGGQFRKIGDGFRFWDVLVFMKKPWCLQSKNFLKKTSGEHEGLLASWSSKHLETPLLAVFHVGILWGWSYGEPPQS